MTKRQLNQVNHKLSQRTVDVPSTGRFREASSGPEKLKFGSARLLYLEKLAGEDERASNKKSHVARGMKELRAAPGAACLGCLDTTRFRLA